MPVDKENNIHIPNSLIMSHVRNALSHGYVRFTEDNIFMHDYNKKSGNYFNMQIFALGYLIGFEKIIAILKDMNYIIPNDKDKTVVIIEKGINNKKLKEILKEVEEIRNEKEIFLVTNRKNNAKYQKECLEKEGYNNIKEIFND